MSDKPLPRDQIMVLLIGEAQYAHEYAEAHKPMLHRLAHTVESTADATPRTHRAILVRGWSRYNDLINNLNHRGILVEFASTVEEKVYEDTTHKPSPARAIWRQAR